MQGFVAAVSGAVKAWGGGSVRRAAGLRCDRTSAIWNITHGESLEE